MVTVEIDVEAHRAERAAYRAENAALRVQITGLVEQVAKLNERITELLAVAQRKHRKPPAPAVTAAPVELDGAAKLAFDERPAPPPLPEKPPKTQRQAKPTGRKPLPVHLLETIIEKRGVPIASSAIAVRVCTRKPEVAALVKALRASSATLRPFG